ncbi:MAG: hypothetical protein QNJ77_13635 [Acidimicrobiia bacterium]|nr:hypothetical protein [Acidimicrobiia bacterium]
MSVGIPPRKWAHGKPIRGFWGGLLLGVGVALVFHQLSWWVLDVNTLVVLPVLSGLLFAGRAWLGQPYR